ncbi:YbaK/EbsC family protein [Vibrio europaeus]|uniref:YbaK/EbsC family protein n=1 Tax=Vibrio europaeus TaxID=300876 RepID=A0A178JHL6_9VIBR|nr:YbaK/EbsC family protein [Vibrio europaeus]MDC5704527.1 YbaK/EbsC family protein [Vibrio europaeus]MDC5709157.1 YbaK/EbsC family protein [Vibrio europaeus]MDC5717503.1 YbaK/EbsC family protein [Vibrio europaeus]MDC5727996.1 YbaK/EbsC family protein [Vibrio europaeus]MDC5730520.1 YbaK/EbsC family protein [Vibrio europaeus]
MTDPISTHITQYLEAQQINFRLLPHQTPATTIEDAAKQRGIRPEQMVKSIVLRDMSNRYAIACAPGNKAVDPKKVRALLEWRRMTCVSMEEVASLTGYKIGTVVPLLLRTPMVIVFDQQLLAEPEVTISSGSNMAGIALSCDDLIQLSQPIMGNICRD